MMDVVQLLADDHERIRARFAAHERAAGGQQRRDIAALLWAELCVHTALERELISVVTRAPSGAVAPDVGLALEREHAAVEALTRRLRGLLAEGGPLEPDLAHLRATALDHCRGEEQSLFPALRRSPSEHRQRLGWFLAGRRAELVAELEAGAW